MVWSGNVGATNQCEAHKRHMQEMVVGEARSMCRARRMKQI